MLTDVLASRRRRGDVQGVSPRAMSQSDIQLYRDLAQASGGQAIEVTKSDLFLATTVIKDSSASALVRHRARKSYLAEDGTVNCLFNCEVFCSFIFQVSVFQAVKNPGRPDNFTFTVDDSLRNMTAYITGASSLTFTLTSSTGVLIANVQF